MDRSPDPILTAHSSLAAMTLLREHAWNDREQFGAEYAFAGLDTVLSAALARIELLERRGESETHPALKRRAAVQDAAVQEVGGQVVPLRPRAWGNGS